MGTPSLSGAWAGQWGFNSPLLLMPCIGDPRLLRKEQLTSPGGLLAAVAKQAPCNLWNVCWCDLFVLHKLVLTFWYLYFPCPVYSSHAFNGLLWAQVSPSRKSSCCYLLSLKGGFLCAFSSGSDIVLVMHHYLVFWGQEGVKEPRNEFIAH